MIIDRAASDIPYRPRILDVSRHASRGGGQERETRAATTHIRSAGPITNAIANRHAKLPLLTETADDLSGTLTSDRKRLVGRDLGLDRHSLRSLESRINSCQEVRRVKKIAN
jgi:cysteine sulfinate desulfinase/cysteine desulfurase-like protein